MALVWKLIDATDGTVIRDEALPVSDESAEVALDIHSEDSAEIDIIRDQLTAAENNNWKNTFALLLRGAALCDTSKEWYEEGAIQFYGFINKLNDDISPRKIKAQVTGLTEYTKSRIVADAWAAVSDPTATVDFAGNSFPELMARVIEKCFSADGIPAGKPKPYQVLGDILASTGDTIKKSVKITDAQTYHSVMTEISEAGGGLEWRFVPGWTDATMTKVVVYCILGNSVNPHINESNPLSLELSEAGEKFSSYHGTFDSTELYSKIYIQSVPGSEETKDGADFDMASVDANEFPVLFERFFNPGVALTTAEKDAQKVARIAFAAKPKYETGFSIEEKLDASEWIQHLGKKLTLTGVTDSPSAGHDAVVRIVGITFTPGKGTVKVQLMQLGPTYPRLPKDRLQGLTGITGGNSRPVSMPTMGGGGGTPPVIPTPVMPGGLVNDGSFSLSDLWGDEGRQPFDGKPQGIAAPKFIDWKETDYLVENFDGLTPIHPSSMTKNEGNRIYGLDHIMQASSVAFNEFGDREIWGTTGLNTTTGAIDGGILPFYIKKTYLSEGTLGPVVTVGQVSTERLNHMQAAWKTNAAYGEVDSRYEHMLYASNWVVDDRYYFALADFWRHKKGYNPIFRMVAQQYVSGYPSSANSKITVISAQIDQATGMINDTDWRTEKSDFPNFGFPVTQFISKYGKNVIFSNFLPCDQILYENPYNEQYVAQWGAGENGEWQPNYENRYSPWWAIQGGPFFGDPNQWGFTDPTYGERSGVGARQNAYCGNLVKDYGSVDAPFYPFTGIGSPGKKKYTYGGGQSGEFFPFTSNGFLYGYGTNLQFTFKYNSPVIARARITPGGQVPPDVVWEVKSSSANSNMPYYVGNAVVCRQWVLLENAGRQMFAIPLKNNVMGEAAKLSEAPYSDFCYKSEGRPIGGSNTTPTAEQPGVYGSTTFYSYSDGNNATSNTFSFDGRLYSIMLTNTDRATQPYGNTTPRINNLHCRSMLMVEDSISSGGSGGALTPAP